MQSLEVYVPSSRECMGTVYWILTLYSLYGWVKRSLDYEADGVKSRSMPNKTWNAVAVTDMKSLQMNKTVAVDISKRENVY